MYSSSPIGVFDSGVGGLSVLRELRNLLPCENVVYVADSAHAPYGDRTAGYVRQRSLMMARFLVAEPDAKMIVIGSNTGTAGGAAALREAYDMPVVAMEPAVKAAVALTTSGIIGVLATAVTLASDKFASLLTAIGHNVQVVAQPAPGLVECIERGDLDGPLIRSLVEKYASRLMERGCDVIVLGSTHYVFLRPLIADVVGPGVTLIDSGTAVAGHVQRVLAERKLLNVDAVSGSESFWTSSTNPDVPEIMARLYGRDIDVQILPAEFR